MKNSPTEVKKKETEERKRQEELEKQKRNETYQLLGGSQNDSDADDDSSLDGNIQQLENYSYFDGDKILESLKLAPKDRKNGEAIYRQQKMNVNLPDWQRYLRRHPSFLSRGSYLCKMRMPGMPQKILGLVF